MFLDTVVSDIPGRGATMAMDNSGRILMLGNTLFDSLGNYHLYLIRLKSNAEFDSSFGNNGVQPFIIYLSKGLSQILPQANGKILLGGFYDLYDCYFQQLLENGALDSSFAQNGEYTYTLDLNKNQLIINFPDGNLYTDKVIKVVDS